MFAAAASLVPDSPDPPRNSSSSKCFRRACSDSFVRCALLGKSALDATDVTLCCQELSCLHASARLFKSMLGIGIRTLAPYAPDKLTCARVRDERRTRAVARVRQSLASPPSRPSLTIAHRSLARVRVVIDTKKSQSQTTRPSSRALGPVPLGTLIDRDFERTVSRV